jgi:hypothetical protein
MFSNDDLRGKRKVMHPAVTSFMQSHPYRILYQIGFIGTSATRRARRLGVESDVGDLSPFNAVSGVCGVRRQEVNHASNRAKNAAHPGYGQGAS